MNILDLQNQLKNLSQEQLIQQMQAPTGEVPQFLLLSEITRRQKMRTAFEGQQGEDGTTVAEDAIASAGVPAGFAGQMAGAMAPQTDMQGNTGAMPQAPMMPEEPAQVPGMAGGGIVALRDGGRPGSPGTFVRDGMVYITNERGEEIPWAPASEVSGLDMPAAPYDLTMGANIGAGADAPDRFTPMLSTVPTGDLNPPDVVSDPLRNVRPVGEAIDSSMTAAVLRDDLPPGQTRAPFPPNMTPAQLEAYTMSAESPGILGTAQNLLSGSLNIGDNLDAFFTEKAGQALSTMGFPGAGAAALTAAEKKRDRTARREEAAEARGAGRAADADFIRFMADPTAEGAAGILPGAVPTAPQAQDPVTEDTVAPTDPQAVAEAEALAAAQAAAAQPGGIAGAPSGGGGIASVAGAAGAAPTDFEQELLSMLAAREKRAEQDKWLALAQFGLQLMSSDAGTLGGAIGEAGGPALDALRSSRETAEGDRLGLLTALEQHRMGQAQLALSQQAAAARAAEGRGGVMEMPDPTAFGMSTDENRQMEVFLRMAESTEPATQLAGQQGVDELVRRIQMRSNMPVEGSGRVPLN